jgi:hypothetical protein
MENVKHAVLQLDKFLEGIPSRTQSCSRQNKGHPAIGPVSESGASPAKLTQHAGVEPTVHLLTTNSVSHLSQYHDDGRPESRLTTAG